MLTPSERKYDPHQKTKLPGKFQQIGANAFKQLLFLIKNGVQAGDGIRIERRGDYTYVSVKDAGSGLGTGGGITMYTATTKAGLPSGVAETALGRVTAGADQGMVCIRNPANDGWDAINVCE